MTTGETREGEQCACIRMGADECWRARYSLPMCESVEADGGPCECPCHDYIIDDDDPPPKS